MKTVKKLGRDLVPGDVVRIVEPGMPPGPRGTLTRLVMLMETGDTVVDTRDRTIVFAEIGRDAKPTMRYIVKEFDFDVEAPILTPAQEHAEELFKRLEWMLMWCTTYAAQHMGAAAPEFKKAAAVLDKIRPPVPPTLAEALHALSLVTEMANTPGLGGQKQFAAELLERARRSGVME